MNNKTKNPRGAAGKSRACGKGKAAAAAKVDGDAARAKGAARKANASGSKRLRPGELDGLVLSQMRKNESELPASPTAIAKAIGRSSGAVGNCLERLTKAKRVRRAKKSPRAYDLKGTS